MATNHDMTIIIPVRNRAGIVGRTLRSVQAQTYRPLRVILVDNNSTDSTLQVLEQWKAGAEAPGFTVDILSETHPGATAARNKGLEAAVSEYVMFFDSDDTMAPGHVARAMEAFRSPARPDIVGWNIRIHPISGKAFTGKFYASDVMWHALMNGSMSTQRYAARADIFRSAGTWNVDAMGWNDIELAVRMLQRPLKIEKLPGITVDTYNSEQSITGRNYSSAPWKWETSLDFMEQALPDIRRKRYARLRRAILAGDYAREASRAAAASDARQSAAAEATRLLNATQRGEPSLFYRLLYRFAFRYVASGRRGVGRLLRPLF